MQSSFPPGRETSPPARRGPSTSVDRNSNVVMSFGTGKTSPTARHGLSTSVDWTSSAVVAFGGDQWKHLQAAVRSLNGLVSQDDALDCTMANAAERGTEGAVFGGMYADELDMPTRKWHMDMQEQQLLESTAQLETTNYEVRP